MILIMLTPPKAIQDTVSPNLSQLQDQLASARDALEEALKKNQNLEEQLAWLKNQIFGRKSEKFITPNPNVLYLPGLEPTHTVPYVRWCKRTELFGAPPTRFTPLNFLSFRRCPLAAGRRFE